MVNTASFLCIAIVPLHRNILWGVTQNLEISRIGSVFVYLFVVMH